ncbi:DUF637 domain-containing protein [Pseudomonas sp. zfem002]|uniref:DUF637 domain-containing protein n=1 Tax=Pseudomonas sp. zfem002 TaxID=3078197 RepID=UPI00292A2846|nr:DUF637 domain-containing protein [Pseudomonas sp. zfem002]MDU9393754.1 DUF637 domain-containing protein [Pseudomonas sp. zfem002]
MNNRGNLGAVFKDVTSSDAMRGYVVSGVTAGLTSGFYDGWTGTETAAGGALPNAGKVFANGGLNTLEGATRFGANQLLQNGTSTLLDRALGGDSQFDDALRSSLANTFAAVGFNAIGDAYVGQPKTEINRITKIGLHAIMGGLAAEATGGNFKTGALAAGLNEAVVDKLASQFGEMPKADKDRLLVMSSQLVGVLAAAASGGDAKEMSTGAWVASNSTQYNHLSDHEMQVFAKELSQCIGADCDAIAGRYFALHELNEAAVKKACDGNNLKGCQAKAIEIEEAVFKWQQLGYYADVGGHAGEILRAFHQLNLDAKAGGTAGVASSSTGAMVEALGVNPASEAGVALGGALAAVIGGKLATGKTGFGGTKGAGNAAIYAADDIRFSQNSVSFNKTDRVSGTNYTYDDLVQSMKTNGWKGDPVDVVKMPDGKLTSMDNTRIAAAREAGIDVNASVRGFDEPLTPAIQEARGWQNFDTWGEAITGRINKQSGGFSTSNPYGSTEPPRISGGRK